MFRQRSQSRRVADAGPRGWVRARPRRWAWRGPPRPTARAARPRRSSCPTRRPHAPLPAHPHEPPGTAIGTGARSRRSPRPTRTTPPARCPPLPTQTPARAAPANFWAARSSRSSREKMRSYSYNKYLFQRWKSWVHYFWPNDRIIDHK